MLCWELRGVQLLGTSGARDQLHADRAHALLGQGVDQRRLIERVQEADVDGPFLHGGDLVVRRAPHAQDDVGVGELLHAVADDLGTRFAVLLVGEMATGARAGLHGHDGPFLAPVALHRVGCDGGTRLAGIGFFGNENAHRPVFVVRSVRKSTAAGSDGRPAGPGQRPNAAVATSATSVPIARAAVAAGDGALSTCTETLAADDEEVVDDGAVGPERQGTHAGPCGPYLRVGQGRHQPPHGGDEAPARERPPVFRGCRSGRDGAAAATCPGS